ncbi:MAG TPA: hypothetical protein VJV96_10085 [Candidatus Angelobacter sp.]|nr:hypothetical protein [Candidatus Angelobacter sp.]
MYRSRCALFLFLLLAGVAVHAQKAEVSLTVGAAVSPDGKGPATCGEAIICPIPQGIIGPVALGTGLSWQTSFAYRLVNFKAAALYLELPLAGSPSRTGPGFSPTFSSFFFTPSAHLKLLPGRAISPFASVGGGVAHFSSLDSSGNAGVLQVGGGLDFRTPLRVLGIRVEARDFITGHSSVAPLVDFTSHVQHVFVGGGIVLKF